jgi:hypothetical protein
MFDLEQAACEWRRQMRSAGFKSPELLDELECHLRDDVEHHMDEGASPQQAFEEAVRRMGQGSSLRREFQITHLTDPMKQKLRTLLIAIALLAVGAGLILPAIAQWRAHASLATSEITALITGTAIVAASLILGALGLIEMLKKQSGA